MDRNEQKAKHIVDPAEQIDVFPVACYATLVLEHDACARSAKKKQKNLESGNIGIVSRVSHTGSRVPVLERDRPLHGSRQAERCGEYYQRAENGKTGPSGRCRHRIMAMVPGFGQKGTSNTSYVTLGCHDLFLVAFPVQGTIQRHNDTRSLSITSHPNKTIHW